MILPAQGRNVLFAVASLPEIEGLCPGQDFEFWSPVPIGPGVEMVLTGLGKANAAGAVARVLDPAKHAGVVSIGIGGCLPGSGLEIGTVVVGSASVFSDEGVRTPNGFIPASSLGFSPAAVGDRVEADAEWAGVLKGIGLRSVLIATVSACSGTNGLAEETGRRTGASVEAMEGAAVGLAASRVGLRFCEIRAVSNTTGDRAGQRWDLPLALAAMSRVFDRIRGRGLPD